MEMTPESPGTLTANGTGLQHEVLVDSISVEPQQRWYLGVKYGVDVVTALLLIIVLAPVVLMAAVLIRLTSRGPAFYLQSRLGRNDRPFTMIKLRTMVHNAELVSGPVWAEKNDERITPVGKFLRATQVDEFPQLINVLLGQMSLIGPRPERPEIVSKLEWEIANYNQRHQVRPGITGLAQLRLPPDTDVDSVRRKLLFDLYYVRQISPVLDFRILLYTTLYFLRSITRELWSRITLPRISDVARQLMREQSGITFTANLASVSELEPRLAENLSRSPARK